MKTKDDNTHEYMTIGEIAKKMGITIRTLQYYDKEGLISPSSQSSGGRRLYSYKDMIQLHQILSLKSLGFSLQDIKERLIPLNSPEEVALILTQQGCDLKNKIAQLSNSLLAIESLKDEVLQMKQVDFKKYADIIVNLQMKNEYYWLIKHFDDSSLDHIRHQFDKESGDIFMHQFHVLIQDAWNLQDDHVPVEDERAQALAKKFWTMVEQFTQGDMSMLPNLININQELQKEAKNESKLSIFDTYLGPALEVYFTKLGKNPFTGVE